MWYERGEAWKSPEKSMSRVTAEFMPECITTGVTLP
jgi:hypothetical protein